MRIYDKYNYISEGIAYINEDKKINIPEELVNITRESNSTYILFEVDNIQQGIKLSDMDSITIVSLNSGNVFNFSDPINVEYNPIDEKLRFGWSIPEETTSFAGVLKFEIRIEGKIHPTTHVEEDIEQQNETEGINYVWKTQINDQLNILQGIDENSSSNTVWFVSNATILGRISACEENINNNKNEILSLKAESSSIINELSNINSSISLISDKISNYEHISELAEQANTQSTSNKTAIELLKGNIHDIEENLGEKEGIFLTNPDSTIYKAINNIYNENKNNTQSIGNIESDLTLIKNDIGSNDNANSIKGRITYLENKQEGDINSIAELVTNTMFGIVPVSVTYRTKDVVSPKFSFDCSYPNELGVNNWILIGCKVKVNGNQYYGRIDSATYTEDSVSIKITCEGIELSNNLNSEFIFDMIFQKVVVPTMP